MNDSVFWLVALITVALAIGFAGFQGIIKTTREKPAAQIVVSNTVKSLGRVTKVRLDKDPLEIVLTYEVDGEMVKTVTYRFDQEKGWQEKKKE